MKDFLFDLIKSGNGWFRMIVGLIVGVWIASGAWSTLKLTLKNHEDRITKLETALVELPGLMKDVRDRLSKHR